MLRPGRKAPAITLKDAEEATHKLKDYEGHWVIVYFYPKDNTPGCTLEAIAFTKHAKELAKQDCAVIGISPDSCASHARFSKKHRLGITLLSDPDHAVAAKYDVWQKKKFMGKEYYGILRSTFLIDQKGRIAASWYGVSAKGHAETVLQQLKEQ